MKKSVKLLSLTLAALMLAISFAGCAGAEAPDDGWGNVIKPSLSGDSLIDIGESQPGFVENPFISTAENNVSTFSADVDTASYSYFRKLVNSGYGWQELLGSGASFRTEEFINYFDYDVSAPAEGELFGHKATIIPCPWDQTSLLYRLTLQAESAVESKGNNLVFLIDVSGSMSSPDKLDLLKKSFSYLVSSLDENDRVSIVTYSGREAVVLEGCQGSKGEMIMQAINSLRAGGSTNGESGLKKAYQIAEANYITGGNNRIIMASDGDLNVGISSADELKEFVEGKRDEGVYLSVLGFGTGNYRDAKMEALADNGNGVYYYIDGESEAEKIFGTDLLGTLYTVAEDVKLQIEFDKNYISEYRLIGYENRLLDEEDFEDDTKDAGDVGAGHQVTVCYELKPTENALTGEDENWMKLAVRYKNPGETLSIPNEYLIGSPQYTAEADDDMKFLVCLLKTTMLLHKSEYIDTDISSVLAELRTLDLSEYPERAEFKALLEKCLSNN